MFDWIVEKVSKRFLKVLKENVVAELERAAEATHNPFDNLIVQKLKELLGMTPKKKAEPAAETEEKPAAEKKK
jgi:hypothetical protein